jgi:hypothetical protein
MEGNPRWLPLYNIIKQKSLSYLYEYVFKFPFSETTETIEAKHGKKVP